MAGVFGHAVWVTVATVRRILAPATASGPGEYLQGMAAGSLWVSVMWIMMALGVSVVGIIGAVRAFNLLSRPDVKSAFH
jgi:hypothetical protein